MQEMLEKYLLEIFVSQELNLKVDNHLLHTQLKLKEASSCDLVSLTYFLKNYFCSNDHPVNSK
jgi:hypothetical protein